MKQIIFDRKNYNTYKDFYDDMYKKFEGHDFIDFKEIKSFNYHADILDEFMWYCNEDNLDIIIKNFDKDKISKQSNVDDYEINIVLKIIDRFAQNYPNNKVTYIKDE